MGCRAAYQQGTAEHQFFLRGSICKFAYSILHIFTFTFSSLVPSLNANYDARRPFALGEKKNTVCGYFVGCFKAFALVIGQPVFYTCIGKCMIKNLIYQAQVFCTYAHILSIFKFFFIHLVRKWEVLCNPPFSTDERLWSHSSIEVAHPRFRILNETVLEM